MGKVGKVSRSHHVTTTYPRKVACGGWHQRLKSRDGRLLVKVDDKYPDDVKPAVRFHEIREDYYMHDEGLPYEGAHRLANQDERRKFGGKLFRREISATARVLAQNRGHVRNPRSPTSTNKYMNKIVFFGGWYVPRFAVVEYLQGIGDKELWGLAGLDSSHSWFAPAGVPPETTWSDVREYNFDLARALIQDGHENEVLPYVRRAMRESGKEPSAPRPNPAGSPEPGAGSAVAAHLASRTIPRDLAVIGELESVEHSNGVWRPRQGQTAYLCTDGQGRDLYVAFANGSGASRWRPWSGGGGQAAAMTKRFHGVGRPTQELHLTLDTHIPDKLRALGEVENILYRPLEPSPKARWSWAHEAGDLGPGMADTTTALCTKLDGSELYFIVTERDRGYPRVTERGIVG